MGKSRKLKYKEVLVENDNKWQSRWAKDIKDYSKARKTNTLAMYQDVWEPLQAMQGSNRQPISIGESSRNIT